jgi:hypothetical protein
MTVVPVLNQSITWKEGNLSQNITTRKIVSANSTQRAGCKPTIYGCGAATMRGVTVLEFQRAANTPQCPPELLSQRYHVQASFLHAQLFRSYITELCV